MSQQTNKQATNLQKPKAKKKKKKKKNFVIPHNRDMALI
jgi:hypothetical protein